MTGTLTIDGIRSAGRRALGVIAALLQIPAPLNTVELCRLLAPLAVKQDFDAILRHAARHPLAVRKICRALSAPESLATSGAHAAEFIGLALIGTNRCDAVKVDRWLLPLLRRSSGRYLPKVALGRFLCARLGVLRDPDTVVAAIESEIPPRAWDDYSNFAELFSMGTWKILRARLTNPRVLTELDLFVTRRDREDFWKALCGCAQSSRQRPILS